MRTFLQRDSRLPRRPLWLRVATVFCVLLVLAASTVQVCHVHDELVFHGKSSPQGPSVPDHCPLCVAMHSALPSAVGTGYEAVSYTQRVVQAPQPLRHAAPHAFELQTRPPPAA